MKHNLIELIIALIMMAEANAHASPFWDLGSK